MVMTIARPSVWMLKKIALLVLILSTLVVPQSAQKAQADLTSASKPRILVLHSYHHGFTWSDKISAGIRSTLQEHKNQVELIFEFLDARRIYTDDYFAKLRELFKVKYADRKIDVIICSDDHALNFAIKQDLFSDIPLVFCSVSGYDPRMRHGRKLTGLQESIEIKATMDAALTLHRGTRQVARGQGVAEGFQIDHAPAAQVQEITARLHPRERDEERCTYSRTYSRPAPRTISIRNREDRREESSTTLSCFQLLSE